MEPIQPAAPVKEKVKKIEEDLPHGVKIEEIYFARNKLPLANNMKVKRFQVKKAIEAYIELWRRVSL